MYYDSMPLVNKLNASKNERKYMNDGEHTSSKINLRPLCVKASRQTEHS